MSSANPSSPRPGPSGSEKRDLVSIEDLSTEEILELFQHADEFRDNLRAWSDLCRGTIMATLFFEPSTRTRLSFESAMLRLGGGGVTLALVGLYLKTVTAAKYPNGKRRRED